MDKQAVKAYSDNLGNHIRCVDITKVNFKKLCGKIDGLIGGPPCQDFSVAGKGAGESGERGKLVWDYLNKVDELKPKWFLFENVKGIVSKKHIHTFEGLVQEFTKLGYTVYWKVLNAWHYGVAQKRERVFIVGMRNDLGVTFEWPKEWPEHKWRVLRDVISGLPELNNESMGELPQYTLDRLKSKSISNSGQENVRVFDVNKPAHTITNNIGNNPHQFLINHYGLRKLNKRLRRFTVRECMRIQSIPDWYVFKDDISLSAQYRIIGNGVPCLLAYQLARQIVKVFKGAAGC